MKPEGDSKSMRSRAEILPLETCHKSSSWSRCPGVSPTSTMQRLETSRALRSHLNSQEILQPRLTPKMTILLGAQLIRQPVRREVDVVVSQDGVLFDRP